MSQLPPCRGTAESSAEDRTDFEFDKETRRVSDHVRVTGVRLDELEALYRRRFAVFLRVAAGILRSEDRALDAVQEGFAAAIRERRRFRGEGTLEAWVWRMVVNAAFKQLRVEPPSPAETSLNGAAPAQHPELRQRMAALPERQRTVLFLRYFADLDYAAIGAALGISPGTVGATLNAAHATLRRGLEEVPQ
jgi:RNA polymerase sigma-70 factor (ECF subfamily)